MKKQKNVRSVVPFFDEESIQGILKDTETVLRSGILTDGPYVAAFEDQFAQYCQAKYAVAVNSGTAALEVPLRHYGVKDKEVIVPTNTFVATPNSVIFAGGKPVFADIRTDTLCIDPEDAERRITDKTAGIIVVHIAGLPCPQMPQLRKLCQDRGLFLLEDAAHAHGAMIDGKKTGTLADAAAFSFYPTKVMTSGEGGMIVTDNEKLAQEARLMRNHGQNSSRLMVMFGHNWCLSEAGAVIGIHQLRNLDLFLQRRSEIAQEYSLLLSSIAGITLFRKPPNIKHSYYKYPVLLDENLDRAKVAVDLKNKYGVETGNIYYPPCHLHPFYRENFGCKEGDMPVSESVLKSVLCLPMHPSLTTEDTRYVAEALVNCLS
jgi:dTDP-4-amino-4,6-dideoxygalactose transaminase